MEQVEAATGAAVVVRVYFTLLVVLGSFFAMAGRCRLTVSEPVLKAPMVSALETKIRCSAFKFCFQFQLVPLHHVASHRRHQRQGRRGVIDNKHSTDVVFRRTEYARLL